jgi:hypothetical protein
MSHEDYLNEPAVSVDWLLAVENARVEVEAERSDRRRKEYEAKARNARRR